MHFSCSLETPSSTIVSRVVLAGIWRVQLTFIRLPRVPTGVCGWIIDIGLVRKVIHPLLREVATPEGTAGFLLFRTRCTSSHFHSFLLVFVLFLCLISTLLFPCVSVRENTLAQFQILLAHTEWK